MLSEINTSICELPRPFSLTMACSISSRFLFKKLYILLYPVYGINTNTVFLVLVGTNGSTGLTGSSLPPHDARTMMEKRRRKKCLSIENKVESTTRNLSLWWRGASGAFIYIYYLLLNAASDSFSAAIFSSESLCFLRSIATTASGAWATNFSLDSFFLTPARNPSRCLS